MTWAGMIDHFTGAAKLGTAVTALFLLAPAMAGAQELPDVRDRMEWSGLRMGSYRLLPMVEAGYFYDSNPLVRPGDVEGSNGLYTAVNAEAKSDFTRHALNFHAGMEHYEYLDVSRQSHTNGFGGADFRLDIQRDLIVLGGVSGGAFHESPGGIDAPTDAAEPIPFTDLRAWSTVTKSFNRLAVSLGVDFSDLNYSDVDAIGGGTLDQDFRDHQVIIGGGRLSYLFSPGYRIFGDLRYNDRHFRHDEESDSHGYRALGGVEFEITRLFTGEVGVGYMWQDYKQAGQGKKDGFSYHLGLTWNPTPLITVNFDGDRTIASSSVPGDPARVLTTFRTVIDYEFRRNVIISPAFLIADDDYSDSENNSTTYQAGIDIDYYLNRYLGIGVNYNYVTRNYKMNIADYDRHLVGVNANGIHASNGILFNHESPMRGETFVTRKITRAVAAISLELQDRVYLGNLDAERDWGHARDYVDGMWRIVQQDEPGDYVLATGTRHSVRSFVETAFAEVGITIAWRGQGVDERGVDAETGRVLVEVDPRYFRPTEVNVLIGDPSKAERVLGWKATTSFVDMVREMVQSDVDVVAQEAIHRRLDEERGRLAALGAWPHRHQLVPR